MHVLLQDWIKQVFNLMLPYTLEVKMSEYFTMYNSRIFNYLILNKFILWHIICLNVDKTKKI